MKINVTEKDIKEGQRDCRSGCPVARAVQRGVMLQTLVDKDVVRLLSYPQEWGYYAVAKIRLTEDVQRFVEQFDAGEPVEPFSFDLTWGPEEVAIKTLGWGR